MKRLLFLNRMPILCRVGFLFAILLSLNSCDSGSQATNESQEIPYQVSATIGMIADVAAKIGGERVQVATLVGPGVDPHLYKPTASDVKTLQSADLIFYNGLLLEGKMSDILVKIARKGKPVYAVTEEVQEQQANALLLDEEDHFDPHLWMDVQLWMQAARVMEKAMAEYDPAGAEIYSTNAEAYLRELAELDRYARKTIASIPEASRYLVTAHDAFGYLSRAYGIEVRGVQGLSTESEAGLRDIEELVSFIVENRIPAIFVESTISDKNIRALVEGAARKGHTVVIGGELYSDAMGKSGSYEGTYLGMIDHNVTTLARALGGKAPAKGLHGKMSH